MCKAKCSKPVVEVYVSCLESGLSVSSATFTTGGSGSIPQVENWVNEQPKIVDWEFDPPEPN